MFSARATAERSHRSGAIVTLVEGKVVVVFDSEERQVIDRALVCIGLGLPARDDERSGDHGRWRALRRLAQPELSFDKASLDEAAAAAEWALERLEERSAEAFWRDSCAGVSVPAGAVRPEKVLAESAVAAVGNVDEMVSLLSRAAALAEGALLGVE